MKVAKVQDMPCPGRGAATPPAHSVGGPRGWALPLLSTPPFPVPASPKPHTAPFLNSPALVPRP